MIKLLDLKEVTALNANEIHEAIQRVVDSGWYLQGQENACFEQHYAQYIGTKECVSCGNGLDALIWIYRAYIELGVMHPGDEVIVSANTYIASILAITENGLKAVLVEPNPFSLELDDNRIEEAITPRTKSILLVHLYGRCAYTDKIGELCKKYSLKLVEDNAQAHGCKYKGQRTGSIGDAAGHIEQMAHGDGLFRRDHGEVSPGRIGVDLPVFEFGDIVLHRVGEKEASLLKELHAGGAGDRLGHGGQLADGLRREGDALFLVGIAHVSLIQQVFSLIDPQTRSPGPDGQHLVQQTVQMFQTAHDGFSFVLISLFPA